MSLTYDCGNPDERAEGLEAAVDSIRRGELVVLPIDASYGLAADAFQPARWTRSPPARAAAGTCRSRSWSAPGPRWTG